MVGSIENKILKLKESIEVCKAEKVNYKIIERLQQRLKELGDKIS